MLDGNLTMKVGGVFLHPNQKVPVVFLVNEKEDEVITLMVGFLEARAIMVSYKQIETPRPLTIDLTLALLDEKYGLKFEKIVIHSITDGAFIADIYIKKNGELIKRGGGEFLPQIKLIIHGIMESEKVSTLTTSPSPYAKTKPNIKAESSMGSRSVTLF